MIKVYRKSDGQELPLSEVIKQIGQKMVSKDKTPLSELYRMEIDGKEVDADSIIF